MCSPFGSKNKGGPTPNSSNNNSMLQVPPFLVDPRKRLFSFGFPKQRVFPTIYTRPLQGLPVPRADVYVRHRDEAAAFASKGVMPPHLLTLLGKIENVSSGDKIPLKLVRENIAYR